MHRSTRLLPVAAPGNSIRSLCSSRLALDSSRSSRLEWPARERLDESTVGLLDDLSLGTKRRGRRMLSEDDWEEGGGSNRTPESAPRGRADRIAGSSTSINGGITRSSGLSSLAPRPSHLQKHQDSYDDAQEERREERRSPAAIFGSKRIGSVVLPKQLVDGIQSRIDALDSRDIRSAYMFLRDPTSAPAPPSPTNKPIRASRANAQTPTLAVAQAATILPGQYAVVRNVVREIVGRLGREKWEELVRGADGEGGVLLWDGGMGSGIWATLSSLGELEGDDHAAESAAIDGLQPKNTVFEHIQASRHMTDVTSALLQDVHGPFDIRHTRNLITTQKPTMVMATYHLSQLTTKNARQRRVQELWNTGAELIILVDHGTKEGFKAISEARSQLLELGRTTPKDSSAEQAELETRSARKRKARRRRQEDDDDVLEVGGQVYYAEGSEAERASRQDSQAIDAIGSHVLAPCPHDGECPLVATRDICHFSQRLQTPTFLRRTKHSGRGQEDSKYSYTVIQRGARPAPSHRSERPLGRVGAVGKDALQRDRAKLDGKGGLIVPLEGSGEQMFHVVRDSEHQAAVDEVERTASEHAHEEEADPEAVEMGLREEAYHWPRLVYPPIKRSGHVLMDTCHPSGSIVRLNLPRSHSKQAYHDARKVSWGDLFPHQAKGTEIVRTRGLKKLLPYSLANDMDGLEEDLDDPGQDALEGFDWPVAGLEDVPGDGTDGPTLEEDLGLEGRERTRRESDVIVRTFG